MRARYRYTSNKSNRRGIDLGESSQFQSIEINTTRRDSDFCNDAMISLYVYTRAAIICELYFDRNMTCFKSSFLCSLFTSCSFHFLCTLSSYARKRVPDACCHISIHNLWPRFGREISSWTELSLKQESCKMKNGTWRKCFFGKFALSKIDSTRVSETAFQFERRPRTSISMYRSFRFDQLNAISTAFIALELERINRKRSLWRNVTVKAVRFSSFENRVRV